VDAQYSDNSKVTIRRQGDKLKGHNQKRLRGKRGVKQFQNIAQEGVLVPKVVQITKTGVVLQCLRGTEIQKLKSLPQEIYDSHKH
jgi:RIO-like serine/threonine protein kinase